MVNIGTTRFTLKKSAFAQTLYLFVCYGFYKEVRLVFVMETQCVYSEVGIHELRAIKVLPQLPLRCLQKTCTCVLLQPLAAFVLTELRLEVIVL